MRDMHSLVTLLPVLRSETQGALLSALMIGDLTDRTIADLATVVGADPSTVLREVDRLEDAGILVTHRLGRSRLVNVNDDSPLVGPLRELVMRALGPAPLLRDALKPIGGIETAFIFGSWAAAATGELSGLADDIDVMVIGEPDRDEVLDAVVAVERRLGRAIDVTFRNLHQWDRTEDPFTATVRSRPIVELR